MNYIKLQQDFLKDFLKDKIKRCYFFESDDYIDISTNGFVVYRVPKCTWLLDSELIKKTFTPSTLNLEQLYKEDDCKPAIFTGTYKKREKDTLMEIKNEVVTAYINEKFVKFFQNPVFMVKNAISPVGVYENGELVGIVCPVKVNK